MLENVEVLYHSSIRINKEKVIYVDPFKINRNYNDADIIFITHNHYDHYSVEDISKVKKDSTIIVATADLNDSLIKNGIKKENIVIVKPNEEYHIDNINFVTIPAYNVGKSFHPKENKWVGYIIEIEGIKYYIAGDTDITKENEMVKCDVALVPVRWHIYNEFERSCNVNK